MEPLIRMILCFTLGMGMTMAGWATDNVLTKQEKAAGWKLLFNGKTLKGWTTSDRKASKTQVEDGCINPHPCGGYMMIHEKDWHNFVLSLDFKMSKGCNSGVFVWTYPLEPLPGKDVGYNGIEMQVLDSPGAGYTDMGAIYDLAKPTRNVMKPIGEWNHAEITCKKDSISVVLNGENVSSINLNDFTQPNRRPDGSEHKFDIAYKDHPRHGYIGLQDHGSPCWYKNIKIKPLPNKGK